MAIMRRLVQGERMTMGTVQPVRMQDLQQKVIAGLFIQDIIDRKVQHRDSSYAPWSSTIGAADTMPSMLCTPVPT